MVRLFGEEKAPLLEHYTDDIESPKPTSDADEAATLEALRAAEVARRRRRCRRRFFHFFTLTLITVAFIGVRHYKRWGKTNISRFFPEDEPHKLPVVPGVTLEHCTDWKEDGKGPGAAVFESGDDYYIPPHDKRPAPARKPFKKSKFRAITSHAEFELDADKPLYFVSRGSFAFGSLTVLQSEDESTEIKTTVTVTTDEHDHSNSEHWHQQFLDVIRVCKIKKDGDSEATGVGIFTPEWHRKGPHRGRHHHHSGKFHVIVQLPKSAEPLTLESFETDMPIFSQTLTTEEGAVLYGNLHLQGALAPIGALDASGENVTVRTSNAPIEGNFRASRSIVLQTENAPINVAVELENANSTQPSTASLHTSNAPITSRNTLTATNWSEDNTGSFNVFTGTANSKIHLTFPSAPINSTLGLTADTSLGNIDVSLHPTYEGEFSLATSLAKADVLVGEGEADPEGKDRKRSALTHPMRSEVSGETWWGEYKGKQKHWGNVKLRTALSPVTLRFNGGA